MKKTNCILALVLALLLALGSMGALAEGNGTVAINKKTFPDSSFRNYVSTNCDKNGDGKLSAKEIRNVKEMYVDRMGIANLKGIEYFTNLRWLSCGNNKLSKLDLTANTRLVAVDCIRNKLTSLKLGKLPKLDELWFWGNKISRVDVGGCSEYLKHAVTGELTAATRRYAYYGCGQDAPVGMDIKTTLTDGATVLRQYQKPTAVGFTKSSLKLKKGYDGTLEDLGVFVTMTPANAVYPFKITCSNSKVIYLESMTFNFITAVGKGTADIVVTCGDKKGVLRITVE